MATLTVDPYAGTSEAFTESMWRETVKSFKPSGDDVFNKRSGEATLVGIVPSVAIKAALRYMLGYAQVAAAPAPVSPGQVYTLCRLNPIRHPYYDQLWCNGAAVREFKPDSTNASTLKKPSAVNQSTFPPRLGFRAGYQWAELHLRFAPTELTYRDDANDVLYQTISQSRMEWVRNTSIDWEPRVETFETIAQYKFAEGAGCPDPYTNPITAPATANRAQIIIKPDVTIRWTDVPRDWVVALGTDNEMPTNILAALGTVNVATFRGFPAGTLLFLGAKMDRFPWALKPSETLTQRNFESSHQYNIDLMFSYFNPPKGFTGNPPVQITTNLGHNNFPYPGIAGSSTPDGNASLWFLATLSGQTSPAPPGQPAGTPPGTLFAYSDFTKIFDSPNNN